MRTRVGEQVSSLSPAQAVLLVIAFGTIVRLLLAAAVGLGIDESYMAGVSRQVSWSYFDHPPIHVWLAGFWAKLFGDSAFVIRLPFIALFAGSTWLMFRLTSFVYGERAGLWAVLAFSLAPAFTLSTGSWVLPDGPMVFFMLLAAYLAARVLLAEAPDKTTALWLWLGAGAAGGAAILCKYLGVFFFAGIGLYLLTSPAQRRWLARPEPWLGLVLAALMFAPVVLWNATNGFASFAFQGQRGLPSYFNATWFLQNVGGQLLYLLPWLAVPLGYAAFRNIGSSSERDRFFVWLAVPAIVTFLVLGFVTRVLPHWAMAGWLFAFPLLGRMAAELQQERRARLRRATVATAVALLGFFVIAGSQAMSGWVNRVAPGLAFKDPTLDLLDWRALDAAVASSGLDLSNDFVATAHWMEAGKVNYAVGRTVPVLCLCSDARHFAFLHDNKDYEGRNALLLSRREGLIDAMAPHFASVEKLPDIVLTRGGQPAIVVKAARATAFKGDR